MPLFGRSKSLPRGKTIHGRSEAILEDRRFAEYPLCHNPGQHHPMHGLKHHHHRSYLDKFEESATGAYGDRRHHHNHSHLNHHHGNRSEDYYAQQQAGTLRSTNTGASSGHQHHHHHHQHRDHSSHNQHLGRDTSRHHHHRKHGGDGRGGLKHQPVPYYSPMAMSSGTGYNMQTNTTPYYYYNNYGPNDGMINSYNMDAYPFMTPVEPVQPSITTIIPGTDLPITEITEVLPTAPAPIALAENGFIGGNYGALEQLSSPSSDVPMEYTHVRDRTIYAGDGGQPQQRIIRREPFIPGSKMTDTYVYRTQTPAGQTIVTITDSERTFYLPSPGPTTNSIAKNIPCLSYGGGGYAMQQQPISRSLYDSGQAIPITREEDVAGPVNWPEPQTVTYVEARDHSNDSAPSPGSRHDLSIGDVRSNDYYYSYYKRDKATGHITKYIPVLNGNNDAFQPGRLVIEHRSNNSPSSFPMIDSPTTANTNDSRSSPPYTNGRSRSSPIPNGFRNGPQPRNLNDSGYGGTTDHSWDTSFRNFNNPQFFGATAAVIPEPSADRDYHQQSQPSPSSEQTYSYPFNGRTTQSQQDRQLTVEEKEAMVRSFEEFEEITSTSPKLNTDPQSYHAATRHRPDVSPSRQHYSLDGSMFRARLDLSHFRRGEIEAKVVAGNRVIVKAVHGNREDPDLSGDMVGGRKCDKVMTKREFFTSYTLPPDCESDKLRAILTKKGYLVIECPRGKKIQSLSTRT